MISLYPLPYDPLPSSPIRIVWHSKHASIDLIRQGINLLYGENCFITSILYEAKKPTCNSKDPP